jgi:hypothetical protein
MKAIQQATHNHKRAGPVVVLHSTEGLARVLIPTSGDEFWVKREDLTELVGGVVGETKAPRKNREQTIGVVLRKKSVESKNRLS